MSPRRSSRARTTQPNLPNSNAASSQSSSRDRTRLNSHHDSQRGSLSDDHSAEEDQEAHDRAEASARQTRQRKTEPVGDHQEPSTESAAVEEEDDNEEEEVTRCVCRREEYPGKPVPLSESGRTRFENAALHRGLMNGNGNDVVPDEGALFIQCDTCKVWQHGGCVGIMEENQCPDNYYCEQCRPELHELMTGARAQRYSRYLPMVEPGAAKTARRPSSANKRDSEIRQTRETGSKSAATKAPPSSRSQRGTVNSRAAWEEEQMILRAIEASKEYGISNDGNVDTTGKRRREESDVSDDEAVQIKKARTISGSESPSQRYNHSAEPGSDEESRARGQNGKKARGVVAQAQRERELRDREKEREKERAEAAGRRKGRAERRHADESEPPEDDKGTPSASRGNGKPKPAPPVKHSQATPTSVASHTKKNARSQRKGRVGRNQYTRDKEPEAEKQSPPGSRDSDEGLNSGDGHHHLLANGSKPSRPRHINPNRTSLNELRKRAAGILEYISRTQVEMAGEKTPPGTSTPIPSEASRRLGQSKLKQELGSGMDEGQPGVDEQRVEQEHPADKLRVDETAFAMLQPRDMMDVLTRELLLWQKQHGKYGEKA